jgi:hypothetical protein
VARVGQQARDQRQRVRIIIDDEEFHAGGRILAAGPRAVSRPVSWR